MVIVQKSQAMRIAKDAGLTRNQRSRLKFRDGMRVDAVWLLISIMVKEKVARDKRRNEM